jgi:ABC-type uncharacterized transport system permease subunit
MGKKRPNPSRIFPKGAWPMPSAHAASSEFQAILQSVSGLPENNQITALQRELSAALQRADHLRAHCDGLEQKAFDLQIEREERHREQSAFAAWLHAEFVAATRALQEFQRAQEKQARIARLELVAAETQCDELERTCRSLLLTLEHAVDADVEGAGASADVSGVSR